MKPMHAFAILAALAAGAPQAFADDLIKPGSIEEHLTSVLPLPTLGRYPLHPGPVEKVPVGAYQAPALNSDTRVKHYEVGEASVPAPIPTDSKGNARSDHHSDSHRHHHRAVWAR